MNSLKRYVNEKRVITKDKLTSEELIIICRSEDKLVKGITYIGNYKK